MLIPTYHDMSHFYLILLVDKKMKNVDVCLSLNDAIYHEMLYQQMRMSTYVKSNAYMVLKSSTTDRCTIVSFLTSRQYAMSSNGFMLVLNPCI